MKKMLLLIVILSMSCSSFQKEIVIQNEKLQNKAESQFPKEKYFFLGSITLTNPEVILKNDRVYMNLNYDVNLRRRSAGGRMFMASKVHYESGRFFLREFEVIKLETRNSNFSGEGPVKQILTRALRSHFESVPVYELNKNDIKQSMAKLLLKEVKTREGKLILRMSL